jgi:hypothetical protein
MVAKKTKKAAKKTQRRSRPTKRTAVMEVRSLSQIPQLEALLKKGPMTLVLVFADWCPACHRFMNSIWKPTANSPAAMNRVAVREDLVSKTSLAGSNYEYLPTLMVVGPDKRPAAFTTPEGKTTNAMPTPQSQQELTQIVNASPSASLGSESPNTPMAPGAPMNVAQPLEPLTVDTIPKPLSPQKGGGCGCAGSSVASGLFPQSGGGLYQSLVEVSRGTVPAGLLGAFAASSVGGRKKHRRGTRKTRKIR